MKIPLRLKLLIISGISIILSMFTLLISTKIMTTCLLIFSLLTFYNLNYMIKQNKATLRDFQKECYRIAQNDKRKHVKIALYLAPSMIPLGLIWLVIIFITMYTRFN